MARLCNSKSQKSNLFRNPNEKEKPSVKCKFKIEYPSVISSEGYGAMKPEKNCNQNSTSKGKVRYQCHYEERMERAERRRKKIIQKLKKNYEIDVEGLNENVTREIIMKAEILEKERKQREKRKIERMVTMMCRLIEEQRYKNRGNKVYPPPWRKSLKKFRGSKCLEQVLEAGGPCMGNVVDERKKCVDFFRGESQTESEDKRNASLKSSELQIPQNPEFASEEEEAEELPRCKDIKKEEDSKITLETVIRKPRFSCITVEYCLESIPRRVVFSDYKKNKVFLEQLKIMNVGWETIHCRYLGIIVHSKLEGRFPIGVAVRDNVKLRPGLCCSTKIRLCSKDDTEELQASIVYETRRQKNPLQHSWFFVPVICVPARAIVKVNPLKIIFPSLTWCEATGPEGFKLLNKTIKIENSGKKACSCKISKTSIEKVDFSEYEGEGEEAEIEFFKSDYHKSKVNQYMSFQYNGEFDGEGYSLDYFEETAKSLVLELLENVFATFRFSKLYYIEIPPLSTVKIQVRFIPQYKGFHHEMYYVQFEDCDNCNEQPIELLGDIKAIPLRAEPEMIDLKICVANSGVYAGTFKLFNESKGPYSVVVKVPPSLKKHAHVYPRGTTILPFNFSHFSVRLYPRITLEKDAFRYYNQSTQVLEFPIFIHPANVGVCKQDCIKIFVFALITDYCLELSPSFINFGVVTTLETIRTELELKNNSLAVQEYGFLNLPKGVRVEPNMGFGRILPKEAITLYLLYSPGEDPAECKEGREGHEFQIAVTSIAKYGGFRETLEPDEETTSKTIEMFWGEDYNYELTAENSVTEELYSKMPYMQPEDSEDYDVCEEESSIEGEELFSKIYKKENEIREFLQQDGQKVSEHSYFKRVAAHGQSGLVKTKEVENRGESISEYEYQEKFTESKRSLFKSCLHVVNCRAIIVEPRCRISESVILLPATSCSSFSLYRFRLDCIKRANDINCSCGFRRATKCEEKEKSQCSFEFQYSCPHIKLEPQSGFIKPGDSVPVTVIFRPEFPAEQLHKESKLNKIQKFLTDGITENVPSASDTKRSKGKQISPKSKALESSSKNALDVNSTAAFELDASDLFAGEKNLAKMMSPFYLEAKVQCVIKTKTCEDQTEKTEVHEMLLICPAIKPTFIYLGNSQEIKFNKVFIGTKSTAFLQVQNISLERISPSATLLNPVGSFYSPAGVKEVLVDPEHILRQPLIFAPSKVNGIEKQFFEIYCGPTNIFLSVSGEGIQPDYKLTPNFGFCLVEAKPGVQEEIKLEIENLSTIPLCIYVDVNFVKVGPDFEEDPKVEEETKVQGNTDSSQKEGMKEKTALKEDGKEKKKSKNSGNDGCQFWDEVPEAISTALDNFEDVAAEDNIFTLSGVGSENEIRIPQSGKQQFKLQFRPPPDTSDKNYAFKCTLMLERVSPLKELLLLGKNFKGNDKNSKINRTPK